MKPSFPTSRVVRRGDASCPFGQNHPTAPVTDWSFQASSLDGRGGGSARFPRPPFHSLSDEFFAAEAKKESRIEGAVFAVIVALAVLPMALAAQSAYGLMQ